MLQRVGFEIKTTAEPYCDTAMHPRTVLYLGKVKNSKAKSPDTPVRQAASGNRNKLSVLLCSAYVFRRGLCVRLPSASDISELPC
jgi:hypothetical protein